ncbi:MAG: hypothetical protein IT250_15040 [Chitinophagaceae bacterium]|nr:hypothetical protein [Chitinophagaceae bacterium]
MYLHISSKQPISDLQKAFSNTFPYLKIEFFKNKDNYEGRENANLKIEQEVPLHEGSFDVTGEMKVSELEQALEFLFPLHARVFRLSGNIWLETSMTNDWTLAHQNEQGKEISFPFAQHEGPGKGVQKN